MCEIKGGYMTIVGVSSLNYEIDHIVNSRLPMTYIHSIKEAGGTPLVMPVINDEKYIDDVLNVIDGLIIPGGDDINPKYFNEKKSPFTKGIDDLLDAFQLKLVEKALQLDMPMLCICRGHQILNVCLNGSIYQDISEYEQGEDVIHDQLKQGYTYHDLVHEVYFKKHSILEALYGEKMMTNSFHHQILKRLGYGLEAIGHTRDGVIEAMRSFNHYFVISVQWHPERSPSQLPLFELFINACKKRKE